MFNVLKYLKYLNYKSQIKLDDLALEDLCIKIQHFLSNKNYNYYLIKKNCVRFYIEEINKKKKFVGIESIDITEEDKSEYDLVNERLQKLEKLQLSSIQKNILKDLINGYSYEEIRSKYNLSSKQLRNIIYYMKNTLKYKTKK